MGKYLPKSGEGEGTGAGENSLVEGAVVGLGEGEGDGDGKGLGTWPLTVEKERNTIHRAKLTAIREQEEIVCTPIFDSKAIICLCSRGKMKLQRLNFSSVPLHLDFLAYFCFSVKIALKVKPCFRVLRWAILNVKFLYRLENAMFREKA